MLVMLENSSYAKNFLSCTTKKKSKNAIWIIYSHAILPVNDQDFETFQFTVDFDFSALKQTSTKIL